MSTRRRSGFTLLELMAVAVILALVSSIVLPQIGFTSSRAVDGSAARLANDLEFARQRTVMTALPHQVVLDLDGGSWRVEWSPPPEEPEAEETGEDPGAGLGRTGLDLSPPATQEAAFEPLPTAFGRDARLEDGVYFGSVLTDSEEIRQGVVGVRFERDGTAQPAEIEIQDPEGYTLVLSVRVLADAVVIRDAARN